MTGLLYVLFFCSGFSGLIYQIVWVREIGNVFGNTVQSAALVIALFMAGLGVGSYLVAKWADRWHAVSPRSMLIAYGGVETAVALLALIIMAVVPHLGGLSASMSSYSRDALGRYELSLLSQAARGAVVALLLAPSTLLMGATLTLLIRHLFSSDTRRGVVRIAGLYAVNAMGAAMGCFLADFTFVPSFGLRITVWLAVSLNVIAAVGALVSAWLMASSRRGAMAAAAPQDRDGFQNGGDTSISPVLAGIALGLGSVAAMGMEIVWVRHITILLGGYRAVLSLLLSVILSGMAAGSLLGGWLGGQTKKPSYWLMAVQALFVVFALAGLGQADVQRTEAAARALGSSLSTSPMARTFIELRFNTTPILLEVGVPALLMGISFPLANVILQRRLHSAGRRASILYLGSCVGGVAGSLTAGFVLLPRLGMQNTTTTLAVVAVSPIGIWFVAARRELLSVGSAANAFATAILIAAAAIGAWVNLPAQYVVRRAVVLPQEERLLRLDEGLTEVIAVTEASDGTKRLVTNGHSMSSTAWPDQRYMRALAHIPLLSMDQPTSALVIGFGVGNTSHAVTLHPSIRRVDVVDVSRDVVAHASDFSESVGDVLQNPRVTVFVNDGRHHLQMQPPASYDLITLEPPPLTHAGVGSLYSKEFYALARTRLKPKGYFSQWIPVDQIPLRITLALVRAFLEVFPNAVLLSGSEANCLLLGANDLRTSIDPARLAAAIVRSPALGDELARLALASPREMVGTFVASAATLSEATRFVAATTDDRPLQEYGVASILPGDPASRDVPGVLIHLTDVAAWCPACFAGDHVAPIAKGLGEYLALLGITYSSAPIESGVDPEAADISVMIRTSEYLTRVLQRSAAVHDLQGARLAQAGDLDAAISEFREALQRMPSSGRTHRLLGRALLLRGAPEEALLHARRAVALDPGDSQAHDTLGMILERQEVRVR